MELSIGAQSTLPPGIGTVTEITASSRW